MAGTTGLEPATSAVTGQRSNQLSYVPKLLQQLGWKPPEPIVPSSTAPLAALSVSIFPMGRLETGNRDNRLSLPELGRIVEGYPPYFPSPG
jgi:hypothetical protein